LNSSGVYNFFYGGTAPSPTILRFSIDFAKRVEGSYIDAIANTYAKILDREYSTITVESIHKKTFDFTIPNVMVSWNKALKLYNNIVVNTTVYLDLSDSLRDYIRHPAVRAWCVQSISYLMNLDKTNSQHYYFNENGTITGNGKSKLKQLLLHFFLSPSGQSTNADFKFDAETCIAEGTFKYWKAANSNENIVAIAEDQFDKYHTAEIAGAGALA